MLKGHVFKFQTFANEAFAHFINTFLQGNMGITKGCNLSKTSNSVTISAGYFCVMGRFLEIVGNETISNITNTGYYQLICEIDLSQTNTTSELNQASIKLVRNANAYSSLTKEDLFNGGSLYQYEFARFKVTEQGIIDFTDKRSFLNLSSLYSQINSNFNTLFNTKDQEADALLEEIRQELASVLDGSAYILKNNVAVLTGTQTLTANTNENVQNNNAMATNWKLNFPTGYNANNCVCIAFGSKFYSDAGYSYELDSAISTQMLTGATYKSITLGAKGDTNKISCYAWNWATSARDFMYKIVLMKIS